LYGEGELADDTEHPNAKAAAAVIKFSQRDDIPLTVGFSIDGGIMQRMTKDGQPTEDKEMGKVLAQTLGIAASLTVKPCNPRCLAFIEGDLQKSIATAPEPSNYVELLRKSQSKTSFIESLGGDRAKIFLKLNGLKKSLDDYFSGFTSMRCNSCSKPVRFFKSTSSMPHKCSECEGVFSMNSIWKAINK